MALKNKIKLSNNVQKIFSGTEVGVLFEEFTSQFKFLGENVLGLCDEVNKISEDLEAIKADVEVIQIDVRKNTDDIEIIKTSLGFIKDGLKKKVDYDDFAILEHRVALQKNHR